MKRKMVIVVGSLAVSTIPLALTICLKPHLADERAVDRVDLVERLSTTKGEDTLQLLLGYYRIVELPSRTHSPAIQIWPNKLALML